MECFRCGTPEFKAVLYDAISPDGIKKVCKKCSSEISMPIIRKPAKTQFEESASRTSVRDRLVRISGHGGMIEKKPGELEKQEVQLQSVVKENLPEVIRATRIPTSEFKDNFHWLIMRQRRIKKLSQKELAREIREPEIAVKLAEQGIVSNTTPLLVEKLQKYLGIVIRKNKETFGRESEEKNSPPDGEGASKKSLSFDPMKTKEMTIGELKHIQSGVSSDSSKPLDERKLSDSDIDDIIFGRA